MRFSFRFCVLGRFLLIQKIPLIGIIFFITSTWLSNVAAQNNFYSYSTMEEQLSNQQELEIFHLEERALFFIEESSSFTLSGREGTDVKALEVPISDESNDDFNPEIFYVYRRKKEPDFDIPIVINDKVEQCIQLFQTTIRYKFITWLARSGKYIPFMKNLLKEHGLPEDLVYMSLIESGFDPYAYSRSKALLAIHLPDRGKIWFKGELVGP